MHPGPTCPVASLSQSRSVSFHLLTHGYFHDSKYSQPWPDIHLYLVGDSKSPDFYRLSMAKHIYSILDLHKVQGIYISRQGRYMHQVFPSNSYNLMHQTYTTQFVVYKNIGGLECSGGSLLVKWHLLGEYLTSWHLLNSPIFWIDLQTPSSGLAPTSRPSRGASSIPKWGATMYMYECIEVQYVKHSWKHTNLA
jgi:hypothetical protein